MTSSDSSAPQDAPRRGVPLKAASRITGLVASVMDLHVRIALKEADREKRRLIGGVVLLMAGLSALLMAWLAADVALLVWLHQRWAWSWIHAALGVMGVNLLLSALFLRIGGLMTKGPYLPETLAGLTKTTRALVGR